MDERPPQTGPAELQAVLCSRGVDPASADHLIAVCPNLLNDDVGDGLPLSELHPELWSLVHQVAGLCRWAHAYDLRLTLVHPLTQAEVASYTVENPDRQHLVRVMRSGAMARESSA